MIKFLLFFVFLVTIYGCNATPTVSNPTVTEALVLNSSVANLQVSGTFYDISSPATTVFPSSGTSGMPCTFYFTTGKHDTVEFTLTFSSSNVGFTYYYGTSAVSATSSGLTFTSPEMTF